MDKPNLIDVAIAPLKALERARGWRRRALLFSYILIALVVGVFAWRELSLWRLPNAPEPFDLKKYGRVNVADADNAMILYRAAGGRMKAFDRKVYKPTAPKPLEETDWSRVDPEVARWAEDCRAALEPWLMATAKPEALVVQPDEMTIMTSLVAVQAIREISRIALLEGSRREQAGDLAGAWQMYGGVLRSSRHAGQHGGMIQRMVGANVLKRAQTRIRGWTDNPGVTSAMLRRAIGDVEACRDMTSAASETIRGEYFVSRDALSDLRRWRKYEIDDSTDPYTWYNQIPPVWAARQFLKREPERSLRVLRLIVAGHLAQADRPPALRPRLLFPKFMIYDHDARTPPAVRALSAAALDSWARDSGMKGLGYSFRVVQPIIDAELGTLDTMRLRMAERAYQLDHGRPPGTYAELLGAYLKDLPQGIEPGDRIGGTPEVVDK